MAEPKKRAGWWSLRGLDGSRDGVMRAIEAAADVPAFWKVALKAAVNDVPADFNSVKLDAHCHIEKGLMNVDITIVPSKRLV